MSARQINLKPVPGALRGAISQGFSLVSAIFLLVILAGLGIAMVNIFTVQQSTSALDVQGVRAYQAARAGIEWGLFQQLRIRAVAGQRTCFNSTSFPLPAGTTLSSFTVTVQCTWTQGATANLDRWQIRATACNQPAPGANPSCPNPNASPDYVQRVVQVEF